MYDRASRVLTLPSASTTPSIGPGTYGFKSGTDKTNAESYAPFQTMSARESFLTINEGVAAAPGPGYYAPISCSNIKGGTSLNNKSNRFHSPTESTPGPGTYKLSSKWVKKIYHATEKDNIKVNRVNFRRQGTAPSIPSSGLNYGYEEDIDGNLKPQELPDSDVTLGPAYYDVPHMESKPTQKYRGVHFGKLSADRTIFKGNFGPGPGDYSPESGLKQELPKGAVTLPLNVPRYHELIAKTEEAKAIPGPGQYDIKSQFGKKIPRIEVEDPELMNSKAPFGSNSQRFLNKKNDSPACTAYQDPRTAFNIVKQFSGTKRTPFNQSSKRFKISQDAANSPGPGTYNDSQVTGMATQAVKKTIFQQSPFGSTSVRTIPLTKKDDWYMPGPAHYQDTNQRPETHRMNQSNQPFGSTSKRLYSAPSDEPLPKLYDVTEAYIKTQGKIDSGILNTGFLSTSERFAPPRDILLEGTDASNPGPGKYETINSFNQQGGFIGANKPRFVVINSDTPGPGAYKMAKSHKDTVLKGTFNVSLGNPLEDSKDSEVVVKQTSFLLGV